MKQDRVPMPLPCSFCGEGVLSDRHRTNKNLPDFVFLSSIPQIGNIFVTHWCILSYRFLLCGQEATGEYLLPASPASALRRASTGSAVGGSSTPGGSAAGSGPPSLEVTPAAASKAVQVGSV